MTIQVTILGLHQVGASIGLALGKIKDQVTRTGSDREPQVNSQAVKMGAVDRTVINLPSAVDKADVVILALPVNEIRSTLEVITPDLKPGVVLIDTSLAVRAVAGWASELLPGEDRYFISMLPSLNPAYLMESDTGIESARADLFHNSLVFISNLPGVDESAMTLATNLAEALGATPLFSDMAEVEGLAASSLLLPSLTAAALLNAVTNQPGWKEARKLAGPIFAQAAEAAAHFPEDKSPGQSALLNSENTARVLNQLIEELERLRSCLLDGDGAALQKQLEQAISARELWLNQRSSANWEIKPASALPTRAGVFGRLFGLGNKKDKKP